MTDAVRAVSPSLGVTGADTGSSIEDARLAIQWGISYNPSPSMASRARRMADASAVLTQWAEILEQQTTGQTRAIIGRHAGGLWEQVKRDAEGHDDDATRLYLRRAGAAWRQIQGARGQLSLF